jgi:hypothetical protein
MLGIEGVAITTEPSDVRVQPAAAKLVQAVTANRKLLCLFIAVLRWPHHRQ